MMNMTLTMMTMIMTTIMITARSCVDLIGCKMSGDTLHACLRLVLRVTRDFKYSHLFVSLGGVNLLMGLDDTSNFPGLLGLVSLIVRHCLEDGAMLKRVIEKVGGGGSAWRVVIRW